MGVPDSVCLQRDGELILAKLRIPTRLRNRPDIDELPNGVRRQRFEKLLDGKRRVTDGEDRQSFTAVRRYVRIAESSASVYARMTEECRHMLPSRV